MTERKKSWTTAADLKAQLSRVWDRGDLLRDAAGDSRFPFRCVFKGPESSELADSFGAVRAWIANLVAVPHIRIEWREVNHRVHGTQRLPQSIWIDTLDDAFALIGRGRDTTCFRDLLVLTHAAEPTLLPWLSKRPLQAIRLADAWPQLLDVVSWMKIHPRPGIYIRQVDVAGVHSKFIEAHRGVLAELFDLAVPASAIVAEHTGVGQFAARYGFLDKPGRIRFRVLDPRIRLIDGTVCPDVMLDTHSFAKLDVPVRRVFVTENEINFLAFPPAAEAIVLFGAGYGWETLSNAQWLHNCAMYYWGDIDTHGFAILDSLRRGFPHTESFLMDRETLMAHRTVWGSEHDQVTHDLPRLTDAERALFNELRDNGIRRNLRLEQEMIGFSFVEATVTRLS